MTKEYVSKLVQLAKDVRDYPGITTNDQLKAERHRAIFDAKLNYLLGYIIALEENTK